MFKPRSDNVIDNIADIPDTLRIDHIKVGTPSCADDTCIMASTPVGVQAALLVAQQDASRNCYEYSKCKTKQ